MTYLSAPLSSRIEFGSLLNNLRLVGEAVEVGTHRGDFARQLIHNWKGKMLHCVDPWGVPVGYEPQVSSLWGGGTRHEDWLTARKALSKHTDRVTFYRLTSRQAVTLFEPNTLDFVYVDGDHRYEMVLEDLVSWYQRLKPGGIIAGHDWVCPGEPGGGWGANVQRAVYDFTTFISIREVQLIVEEGGLPWSFYAIKPLS